MNNYKKKTLFIGIFLLMGTSLCQGQITSKEIWYPDLKGDSILIRTVGAWNGTLMYYKWEDKQYFLYTLHNAFGMYNTPYKYPLPTINAIPYGQVLYTIKDMEIVGNRCVCCGQMRTPVEEEFPVDGRNLIYESSGFIGWANLDNTFSYGNSIKFQMVKVKNTTDLRRLDVRPWYGDTLVAIIGTSDLYSHAHCLVTMHKNGGANDTYSVIPIDNPGEQLTDVAFTEGMVVTVSKFYDEHRTFGLRGGNITDVFNNPPTTTDYESLHKFNTPVANICGYDSWHSNDAELKMVAEPQKNHVTVGYDGYYLISNNQGYRKSIDLFRILINNNDYELQQAQSLAAYAVESEWLMDMEYNPYDTTIVILCRFQTDPVRGELMSASLENGNVRWIEFPSNTYLPMAIDVPQGAGGSVWVGGSIKNSFIPFQFWQNTHFYYSDENHSYWESCYHNELRNNCKLEAYPLPPVTHNMPQSNTIEIIWTNYTLNAVPCQKDTVCYNLYEDK